MRCPFCHHDDDRVIDSRSVDDGESIRRRRECENCGRRFTTYEKVEDIPLRVIKKDGSIVSFDRKKIVRGVERASWRRNITADDIERIVQTIEKQIQQRERRDIESRQIGEWVMKELRRLDAVTYIRFCSVYRDFSSVDEFRAALEEFETEVPEPG